MKTPEEIINDNWDKFNREIILDSHFYNDIIIKSMEEYGKQ